MVDTWLAGIGGAPDAAQVRDDQGRVWARGGDGQYHTSDGRHHQTASELHNRTDLTRVR